MNAPMAVRFDRAFMFRDRAAHDAVMLGSVMAKDFLEHRAVSLAETYAEAALAVGVAQDHPLFAAGMRVAAKIDAGHGDGAGNGYHNRGHFRDVVQCAQVLARLNNDLPTPEHRLDGDDLAVLMMAALIHDYGHDGVGNRDRFGRMQHFRLERMAVDGVMGDMRAAQVPEAMQERVRVVVLTTDINGPAHYARAIHRAQFRGGRMPLDSEASAVIREPLAGLRDDLATSHVASLMRVADILPSAGLSEDHQWVMSDMLSAELGAMQGKPDFRLGLGGARYFIEEVVGTDGIPVPGMLKGTPTFENQAGRVFDPNLVALYRAVLAEIDAADTTAQAG